jgi:hypothetical protein
VAAPGTPHARHWRARAGRPAGRRASAPTQVPGLLDHDATPSQSQSQHREGKGWWQPKGAAPTPTSARAGRTAEPRLVLDRPDGGGNWGRAGATREPCGNSGSRTHGEEGTRGRLALCHFGLFIIGSVALAPVVSAGGVGVMSGLPAMPPCSSARAHHDARPLPFHAAPPRPPKRPSHHRWRAPRPISRSGRRDLSCASPGAGGRPHNAGTDVRLRRSKTAPTLLTCKTKICMVIDQVFVICGPWNWTTEAVFSSSKNALCKKKRLSIILNL